MRLNVRVTDVRVRFKVRFLFEGISLLKNRSPGPTDPSYKTHNGGADSCRARHHSLQTCGGGRTVCSGSCTYRLAEPSKGPMAEPTAAGPGTTRSKRVVVAVSGSCTYRLAEPFRGPYERVAQRDTAGMRRLRCVACVRRSRGRRRGCIPTARAAHATGRRVSATGRSWCHSRPGIRGRPHRPTRGE